MLAWWLLGAAFAGYGDAGPGWPNWEERDLHLWSNAARVAPEDFKADYVAGGCAWTDFTTVEQSAQAPLFWNASLNEAARFHSDDMYTNGWFDHDSSDGTLWYDRIWRYYTASAVGENIAYGYFTPYSAVFEGWMCSPGHRANLKGEWDELGTGVTGRYYTQDFGLAGITPRAIAMGTHEPKTPSSSVTFYADFFDELGDAPDGYVVVLDGVATELTLLHGAADQGVYTATIATTSACHEYYFAATVGGVETRFPEDGSYGWGSCAWDDAEAQWVGRQLTLDACDADGDGVDATDCGGTDCDDADASVYPGATEACDGVDDDCDGVVDDGLSGTTWYADADRDGYGDASSSATGCTAPSGHVSDATDCDDADATVHPTASEACDGVDDDCDGAVDEGAGSVWYADADGDGHGDATLPSTRSCTAPTGYVSSSDDCDDTDASVYAGAAEVCDFQDNDCDASVDEGLSKSWFYADVDGDGYGDRAVKDRQCGAGPGWTADATDCDDVAALVYPGATELCDGVDNDCDGRVDEGATSRDWYGDADGDGWGDAADVVTDCVAPTGYVADAGDCEDADPDVNPDATDVCNGVDDDCDGRVDAPQLVRGR